MAAAEEEEGSLRTEQARREIGARGREDGGQTVGRRRSGQSSGPKLFSPIYVFGSHMLLLEGERGVVFSRSGVSNRTW